jgi:hypothetical protein
MLNEDANKQVKEKIISISEFFIKDSTYCPKLSMKVYDMSIDIAIRHSEIQSIVNDDKDCISYPKKILLNEFVKNRDFLNRFRKLYNRERNLNILLGS